MKTKLNILSDSGDYTIEIGDKMVLANGPMFLKTIIRTSTVDAHSLHRVPYQIESELA